jgi:hypothetical protein
MHYRAIDMKGRVVMHRIMLVVGSAALALWCVSVAKAEQFSAKFSGFEEIGALGAGETGAILSPGQATLDLTLDRQSQALAFTLTYSGLSSVSQAHIHFGKRHVAGGIMVFFCSNLPNPPAGTQSCPTSAGTVSGTITAASVIAVPGQNITAGDFDALTQALLSNTAYGNIHTSKFPAGEIRGQIRRVREEKKADHGDDQKQNQKQNQN